MDIVPGGFLFLGMTRFAQVARRAQAGEMRLPRLIKLTCRRRLLESYLRVSFFGQPNVAAICALMSTRSSSAAPPSISQTANAREGGFKN
jgi:hypothetical protein